MTFQTHNMIQTPSTSTSPSRAYLPLLLLGILAVILYWAALPAPFMGDDYHDVAYIAETGLGGLLTDGLWGLEGGAGRYRPILHLSCKLDWLLFGNSPFGFHLVSLLLHLANGILLFRLLRGLGGAVAAAAAWSAGIWLIVPTHVEAVAWWSARGGLLAVFFALIALERHVAWRRRFARGEQIPLRRRSWIWLAALAAHLSYETVVLLPAIVVVLELFVLPGRGSPSLKETLHRAAGSFLFFGSALAVTVLLRNLILSAAFGGELFEVLAQVPRSEWLGLILESIWARLQLFGLPFMELAWTPAYALPFWIPGVLVLAYVVLVGGAYSRRDLLRRAPLAWLGLLVLLLAPSAFVQIWPHDFTNARLLYPIQILVVIGLAQLTAALPALQRHPVRLLWIVLWALSLHSVVGYWRGAADEAGFWASETARLAEENPHGELVYVMDPPLMRGGFLVLENAVGALLRPPHARAGSSSPVSSDSTGPRSCVTLSVPMLQALSSVPEKAQLRAKHPLILRRQGDVLVAQRLPAEPLGRAQTFPGGDSGPIRIAALDIAAVRVDVAGLAGLEWEAESGAKGSILPQPLAPQLGGGLLFPISQDVECLLAGPIVRLRVLGGEPRSMELLSELPQLRAIAPAERHEIGREDAPPAFEAEALGAGVSARVQFIALPGPLPLGVPIAGPAPSSAPAELRYRLVPELEAGKGGFVWPVFADALLFDPRLEKLYWCFEELDPLGRAVARSPLRELRAR
jgi:hypothetical protein